MKRHISIFILLGLSVVCYSGAFGASGPTNKELVKQNEELVERNEELQESIEKLNKKIRTTDSLANITNAVLYQKIGHLKELTSDRFDTLYKILLVILTIAGFVTLGIGVKAKAEARTTAQDEFEKSFGKYDKELGEIQGRANFLVRNLEHLARMTASGLMFKTKKTKKP